MLETTKLWHGELIRNVTGVEAVTQRENLKASHAGALEAVEVMTRGLEFYIAGKPIYAWEVQYDAEGNLIEVFDEGRYKIIKADGTTTNDIKHGFQFLKNIKK